MQGRYAEAQPLSNRALVITEKALGPEHRDVVASVRNLAQLMRRKAGMPKLSLINRPLVITEKALGPEHPNVAAHLNNLSEL